LPVSLLRQEVRKPFLEFWPAAQHIVIVGLDHDAGRLHWPGCDLLLEILKKLLLPEHHLVFSGTGRGISQESWRPDFLKRLDDRRILGLWLVDQDVDADCLGLETVDPRQRLGKNGAVERRALARRGKRLVGIDDHDDAAVLIDLFRRQHLPPVIQRPLGLDRKRDAIRSPARPTAIGANGRIALRASGFGPGQGRQRPVNIACAASPITAKPDQ